MIFNCVAHICTPANIWILVCLLCSSAMYKPVQKKTFGNLSEQWRNWRRNEAINIIALKQDRPLNVVLHFENLKVQIIHYNIDFSLWENFMVLVDNNNNYCGVDSLWPGKCSFFYLKTDLACLFLVRTGMTFLKRRDMFVNALIINDYVIITNRML